MIPPLVAIGLIFGRWWLVRVAAFAWPIFLVAMGSDLALDEVPLASGLAMVNTFVGVILHQGIASLFGFRIELRGWRPRGDPDRPTET
jgi:hypothetical protein